MRWTLLRRGSRVRGRARQKLHALLLSKLAYGTRLGVEGNLYPFLDVQVLDLGEGRFWIIGVAEPCGVD